MMESDGTKLTDGGSTTKPARRISRRAFLLGGSIVAMGVGALTGALALQPTLSALVDTIIPADEFGPSASQTGAVEAIWAPIEGRVSHQIRVRMALALLNLKAGGSFAAASEETRVALLNEIAQRPAKDKLRRFYDYVRTHTMRHYYGDAARALALGFVGPPQPDGYRDAAAPWKVAS